MSIKKPVQTQPETDVSELKFATAYGIEGLEKCQETDEYDSWLELFGVVVEELDSSWNRGQGNFPLKEFVIPENDKQSEIIDKLEDINREAEKIKEKNVEHRSEMDDKISDTIEEAEQIYDKLDEIEKNNSSR